MKNILITIILACVGILASCSDDSPGKGGKESKPRSPIELTSETRAIAENLKEFYALYTKDVASYVDSPSSDSKKGNFICSPLGAAMVFGMTANGVDELTQEYFCKYLGVSDIPTLNDFAFTLIAQLPKADDLSNCKIANSIWVNSIHSLTLSDDFSQRMKNKYFSSIFYSDLSTISGVNAPAQWCADILGDNNLFPPNSVNRDCIAILMNALYLKTPWQNVRFETENTSKSVFHGMSGDTMVDMMKSNCDFAYISDSEYFTLCSLSLGNGTFSFDILIPQKDISIKEATEKLTSNLLEEMKSILKREPAVYRFPKFNLQKYIPITEVLGCNNITDLSGLLKFTMFKEGEASYLSKYYQTTSLSVDEVGAEIKSVSVGELASTSPVFSYREVNIDRPFFFFINEYSTGACLLSGRITDL